MAAAAEDVEFVDYDRDEEEEEDAMDEDDRGGGRGGRALPVPHIVSQGVMRSRGRLLGRSTSVLASNRDRFDSLADAGNPGHGPQRCEISLCTSIFFLGVSSSLNFSVGFCALFLVGLRVIYQLVSRKIREGFGELGFVWWYLARV